MTKPRAIIVELDGVLSDDSKRRHLIDRFPTYERESIPYGDSMRRIEHPDGKPDFEAYHAKCGEDGVNEWCKEICWHHPNLGASHIIIISDRPEKYRKTTEKWLSKLSFEYQLFMRLHFLSRPELSRPNATHSLYFEDVPDNRAAHLVKREIYEKIRGEYEILFVIDKGEECCKMWKSLGLTVLQVK